jgi:hypothetical protein
VVVFSLGKLEALNPRNRMVMEGSEIAPKFDPGRLVATPGALASIDHPDIMSALSRHVRGDWGDLCDEDWKANEDALVKGSRLFSVFLSEKQVRFYIITEWDRSLTTVLLPSEY